MKKLFVLSLGGSLISTKEGIDAQFLKRLKVFIDGRIKKGERFILTCGGGLVCRQYQHALAASRKTKNDDLDWIGIAVTRLNAELVRQLFKEHAFPYPVNTPDKKLPFKQKIMTACGNVPGHSSDHDAVHLARTYGADTVINLSNINYLYNKDPNKHADAEKIEDITWADYIDMVGSKWVPGANVPFDPIASAFAKKHKLTVLIANGQDFQNLGKILDGKKFKGTVIS